MRSVPCKKDALGVCVFALWTVRVVALNVKVTHQKKNSAKVKGIAICIESAFVAIAISNVCVCTIYANA